MQRWLLVEPEPTSRQQFCDALSAAGYEPLATYNAEEALALIHAAPCAGVLLARDMPLVGGSEALRRLRGAQPLLALFIVDRAQAARFERHGDEPAPVVRPPVPGALRRQIEERHAASGRGGLQPRLQLRLGPLTLDMRGHEAYARGAALGLTRREFALLRIFCDHVGQVLSADDLNALVWSGLLRPGSQVLTVHIHRLRAKLSATQALGEYLRVRRGQGYVLNPGIRGVA